MKSCNIYPIDIIKSQRDKKQCSAMPIRIYRIVLFVILVTMLSTGCFISKSKISADDAFLHKHYATAIDLYQKRLNKKSNNSYHSDVYRLAESYREVMDYENAEKYYHTAYQNSEVKTHGIKYADLLRTNEKYKNAIGVYKQILKKYGEDKSILRSIQNCQKAISWKNNTSTNRYKISLDQMSSAYSEYSPSYFHDSHIVYSSDRAGGTSDNFYSWTGNGYSDIYVKSIRGGESKLFDIGINSEANEGALCFSSDGKELFFTRCDMEVDNVQYCKLMYSHMEDGYWSEPEKIKFFPNNVNEVHPCFMESDSVLIFAANPPDSRGGYDLYYSSRNEKGWSAVYPMPDYLNTVGDEKFPTAHNDTLYFSSDFLPGMGGLDIFESYLKSNGKWSLPQNLETPINSGADDFSLVVSPVFVRNSKANQQGLLVSNRAGGKGMDDIYRYIKTRQVSEKMDSVNPKDLANNVFVLFTIRDYQKQVLPSASILINEEIKKQSDEGGKYFFLVQSPIRNHYLFSKSGYLNKSFSLDLDSELLSSISGDTTINISIILDPYITDKEIVLKNVYYDFDKSDLRNDAKQSLQVLVELLVDNPSVNIELASHTDCKGKQQYNQLLSQRRAQSVIDYLVSKGIASTRLKAVGYGESNPVDNCDCDHCSDESLQLNRRTSFKILK